MYIETRSQTITEAIDKLYAIKTEDLVFGCPIEALTDAQRKVVADELYNLEPFEEDYNLAKDHIFVNLTDNHIYMLEMADYEDDETVYYFVELIPLTEIYKDENGNLWNWCDYDKDEKLHEMTVVECDDGHYTDTCITWFFTQAELNAMTKISVNA